MGKRAELRQRRLVVDLEKFALAQDDQRGKRTRGGATG